MAVDWKVLKREIHDEVEKIWLKEPPEVTMSKLGVFPSGAGTNNQYLGNLFFLNADTQAMGWWTIEPTMYCVLGDDMFSLDVCKKLFDYLNAPIAHLLGDVLEPNCPAPWLNMPKFAYFHDKIVESYPTIETKEDFRDLLWSWFCYVNRINSWFYTVLPWELGKNLQRKDPDDVAQLADLLGYKLEKK